MGQMLLTGAPVEGLGFAVNHAGLLGDAAQVDDIARDEQAHYNGQPYPVQRSKE